MHQLRSYSLVRLLSSHYGCRYWPACILVGLVVVVISPCPIVYLLRWLCYCSSTDVPYVDALIRSPRRALTPQSGPLPQGAYPCLATPTAGSNW
jgi:hypothetical protein